MKRKSGHYWPSSPKGIMASRPSFSRQSFFYPIWKRVANGAKIIHIMSLLFLHQWKKHYVEPCCVYSWVKVRLLYKVQRRELLCHHSLNFFTTVLRRHVDKQTSVLKTKQKRTNYKKIKEETNKQIKQRAKQNKAKTNFLKKQISNKQTNFFSSFLHFLNKFR